MVLDESAVRHSLKNHGNPELEQARGNIAINPNDFLQVAGCLQSPDIVLPGKTEGYLECRKQINGHLIVVSTVRRGRKKVAVVTVYKKPRPPK